MSEDVIKEKFENLEEKIETNFDAHTELLKDIKEQTTKTNGRVTELEKKDIATQAKLDSIVPKSNWTNNLVWGCTFAFPLLAIWAGWLTSETLNAQKQLSPVQQAAITQAVINALQEVN